VLLACGHPVSSNVARRISPRLQFSKRAPVSASDADGLHDGCCHQDGSLLSILLCVFHSQYEMSCCPAACLQFREVGGIRLDLENHVGSIVANGGVRMSVTVVEELDYILRCLLRCLGLLRCQCAEGHIHSRINSSGVVLELVGRARFPRRPMVRSCLPDRNTAIFRRIVLRRLMFFSWLLPGSGPAVAASSCSWRLIVLLGMVRS
jgi:hypothetical protein